MIAYVLMNIICGKFNKITIAMYVLAILFIFKFVFIREESLKKVNDKQITPTEITVEG